MDQIRQPAVKLVVTDMDNTLLSTQKQQALGLEEAVQNLSAKTRIPETELYQQLGTVMEKYHSHSYPWTLELALKDKLKIGEAGGISIKDFNEQIADPFWNTVDASMKHLELYPGVRSTLDTLAQRHIPVAVLSDASASSGLRRFLHLELDGAPIDRLFTLRNPAEPAELPEALKVAGRERLNQALSKEHNLAEFKVLPREWEKPSAGGLQAIIDQYQLRPSQVLMVGDSVRRDMGVAANTGARGLHADYVESEPQYEAIMKRFKDPNVKVSFKDKTQERIPFEDTIFSYAELPKYLEPKFKPMAVPHLLAASAETRLVPPMVLSTNTNDVD
jgi:FMN phosphatase YigB (HAD superfamily)